MCTFCCEQAGSEAAGGEESEEAAGGEAGEDAAGEEARCCLRLRRWGPKLEIAWAITHPAEISRARSMEMGMRASHFTPSYQQVVVTWIVR